MRKELLLGLATTALLATSCSNDEAVEMPLQKSAISFSTFVDRPTRATTDETPKASDDLYAVGTDVTTSSIMRFMVWGMKSIDEGTTNVPEFDRQLVQKTLGENSTDQYEWTYSPEKYWTKGYKYNFFAVAPATRIATSAGTLPIEVVPPTNINEIGQIILTNISSSSSDNLAANTDVVVAYSDENTKEAAVGTTSPGSVNLTFYHILSRANFKFTNAMEDGSIIRVHSIFITNAIPKATASFTRDATNRLITTWSNKDKVGTDSEIFFQTAFKNHVTSGISNLNQGDFGITEHHYFIPLNPTSGSYDLKVQFNIERDEPSPSTIKHPAITKFATITAPEGGWKPGYSYTFTASIDHSNVSGDELYPIKFTVTGVNTWPTPQEINNMEMTSTDPNPVVNPQPQP